MFFYHAHPRKDVGLNFVLKKKYILAMIDQTYLWSIIWKLEKHSDSCFDWWKKEQSTVFEAKKILYYPTGLKKFLPHYIDGLSVYFSKYLSSTSDFLVKKIWHNILYHSFFWSKWSKLKTCCLQFWISK